MTKFELSKQMDESLKDLIAKFKSDMLYLMHIGSIDTCELKMNFIQKSNKQENCFADVNINFEKKSECNISYEVPND